MCVYGCAYTSVSVCVCVCGRASIVLHVHACFCTRAVAIVAKTTVRIQGPDSKQDRIAQAAKCDSLTRPHSVAQIDGLFVGQQPLLERRQCYVALMILLHQHFDISP